MIPNPEPAGTGVRLGNKIGNIAGNITDHSAGKGDHTKQHNTQANNNHGNAGLTHVRHHKLDTARIQHHRNGIKHRGPKTVCLEIFRGKLGDNHC